ncbi:MAG: hypothetical protein ACYS8X_03615 [Planctomycetota bacterium]
MNILTKISVVVLALLSVFAGVVFSRMAVIPENWRHAYDKKVQEVQTLTMEVDEKAMALKSADLTIERLKDGLAKSTTDAEKTIGALKADLAKRVEDQERQQNELDELNAGLKNAQELLKSSEDRRALLNAQLKELDAKHDKLRAEHAATINDLDEAQAQIDRDHGEKRVLREDLAHRVEEIKALEDKLSAAGGEAAVEGEEDTYVSPTTLNATVTAVRKDGLASINIGRVQGIRQGLQMYIYRGSEFVAHLRIDEVDDNEAAGVVFRRREGMTVRQGDRVTTSLK